MLSELVIVTAVPLHEGVNMSYRLAVAVSVKFKQSNDTVTVAPIGNSSICGILRNLNVAALSRQINFMLDCPILHISEDMLLVKSPPIVNPVKLFKCSPALH